MKIKYAFMERFLECASTFDLCVACFRLIPEADSRDSISSNVLLDTIRTSNAVPGAGDPVSEIVKLNRARANEKRHASLAAFSIRGRSRATFEIIEAVRFLV